jgi:hypothetical protein
MKSKGEIRGTTGGGVAWMIGNEILERMAAERGVEEGMMSWWTEAIMTTSEREGAFDPFVGRRQGMAKSREALEMERWKGAVLIFLYTRAWFYKTRIDPPSLMLVQRKMCCLYGGSAILLSFPSPLPFAGVG